MSKHPWEYNLVVSELNIFKLLKSRKSGKTEPQNERVLIKSLKTDCMFLYATRLNCGGILLKN